MNHLPTSILNLLGFTSSKNSSEKKRDDGDEDEEGDVDLTNMVKKLVQDQHRTMFYIATLNPEIQNKTVEHSKVIAPSLKVSSKYLVSSRVKIEICDPRATADGHSLLPYTQEDIKTSSLTQLKLLKKLLKV